MGLVGRPIFPRIARRFLVRQQSDQQLETGAVLVPTTNADELLRSPKSAAQNSTATNIVHAFTVPEAKRWTVKAASGNRDNAAVIDIFLRDPEGNVDVNLAHVAATETAILFNPGVEIKLDQGWSINVSYAAGVSGGLDSAIFYEEEDLF